MAPGKGTTAQRSEPLGARHVAIWGPDGWQVTCSGRGKGRDGLTTAAEYVASLPNRKSEAALDSFLTSPGRMAVFEMRRDGTCQALGVKVIPYRTTPVLCAEPLTTETQRRAFNAAHPVLARKKAVSCYSWDSPFYRAVCAEMGLDPDENRPRYYPHHAVLAAELERWTGEVFADSTPPDSHSGEAKTAAFDLLDLMRADRGAPDPALHDKLQRRWTRIDARRLPCFGQLDRLVRSDALLDPANADAASALGLQVAPRTSLTMLPSRYSAGHNTTITGFWRRHAPADWPNEDTSEVRGIAIEPAPDAYGEHPWLHTALSRLREQAVLILTEAEAQTYLASDEAAYWVWRHSGARRYPQVRLPTLFERLRWQVRAPSLVRDRELAQVQRKLGGVG